MTTELKVSEQCYNEIANALDAAGKKVVPGAVLTIEKDISIVNPLDWRLITLRRDVIDIAAKVYAESDDQDRQTITNFVQFASSCFEFVKLGTVPEKESKKVPPKRTEPLQQVATPVQKWGK